MKHWRTKLLGLALACGLAAGCSHPVFVTEKDLQAVNSLPPRLESDPKEFVVPRNESMPTPADVDHPDRAPRLLSLEEAFAIGLENGTSNSRQPGTGLVNDDLISFGVGPTQASQTARV